MFPHPYRALVKHTALFAAVVPGLAGAETLEERVTFPSEGQEVVATLAVPEGAPAPVVLLLHGFTGARDELATDAVPEGVFARLAGRLAAAGFASLRIDFRGSGESVADLTFADTTFEGQVTDARAAIDYLRQSAAVDGGAVSLVGWSQGGLVATAAAGRDGGLDAVALWNAVAEPTQTFGALFGAETMEAGRAAGADEPVEITLPWASFPLNGAFFDGLDSFDPAAEIAAYSGPLFVAQGTQDTTVAPVAAEILSTAHPGETSVWMGEMDHVFNIFATDDQLEELIERTIAFLEAQAR